MGSNSLETKGTQFYRFSGGSSRTISEAMHEAVHTWHALSHINIDRALPAAAKHLTAGVTVDCAMATQVSSPSEAAIDTTVLPTSPADSSVACFDARISEEHVQWEKTAEFLQCDPFLHHVNNYTNWFNNSHQIVRHQSRPFIRPQALTTVTCAFGNLMAPKLVRCLGDSSLHVRQKPLLWVAELAATAEGRVHCLKAGMLEALVKRFDEQDAFMKQQLALVFGHFAEMQDTCVKMSNLGFIKWLLKMVLSNDDKLRELSLSSLLNVAFNETVRLELVHGELTLESIMEISNNSTCERCATLGLRILRRCLAGGTDKLAISKLLHVDAIATLLNLLKSSDEDLQESSLRLIGLLSMDDNGKSQTQNSMGIDALLQFLKKGNSNLQTAATSALMSVTIDIDAKKDFIAGDGIPSLVPHIDSSSKILSFNSLQLATNIAEHPNGRQQLHNQIQKVHHLIDTSHSEIQKRFAKVALQQMKFKHRPFK